MKITIKSSRTIIQSSDFPTPEWVIVNCKHTPLTIIIDRMTDIDLLWANEYIVLSPYEKIIFVDSYVTVSTMRIHSVTQQIILINSNIRFASIEDWFPLDIVPVGHCWLSMINRKINIVGKHFQRCFIDSDKKVKFDQRKFKFKFHTIKFIKLHRDGENYAIYTYHWESKRRNWRTLIFHPDYIDWKMRSQIHDCFRHAKIFWARTPRYHRRVVDAEI